MASLVYHLAFLVVDLLLLRVLVPRWRSHAAGWRAAAKLRHRLGMALALAWMLVATVAWLAMTYASIAGWIDAMDASTPRGLFEVFWVVGLVAYGLGIGFAEPLHLLAQGRSEEMLRLH